MTVFDKNRSGRFYYWRCVSNARHAVYSFLYFTLTNNRVCLLQEVAATGWGIRSGNAGDGGQPRQQEAGHVGNHSRRKGREKVCSPRLHKVPCVNIGLI